MEKSFEKSSTAPTKEKALKLAEEEIEKWKRFFEWRAQEMKKEPKDSKDICSCIRKPSPASEAHGIEFHVCEEHAKEFGIPAGPHWKEDFAGGAEERAKRIMEQEKYWSDTDYRMKKNMEKLKKD